MSLSNLLLNHISKALRHELITASPGHCLRVDNLHLEDARELCSIMRTKFEDELVAVNVLSTKISEDDLLIQPQRAIEIRNRKTAKLCLFVPTDTVDATASSLVNSFAAFDLTGCMQSGVKELIEGLPDEIRQTVRHALSLLGRTMKPPIEAIADYLGDIHADPSLATVGREMWRLGLIPDIGNDELLNRLNKNRDCVRLLVQPAKAHSSASERVASLGLRSGGVKDDIISFFEGRRLRKHWTWLEELANEPYVGRITFEKWSFESEETSDLESIEVAPLLNEEGIVEKYTRLVQPNDEPGTQPIANVGPKAKVSIKWNCLPVRPNNLKRWKCDLIASREEYAVEEVMGIDLPSVKVAARARKASIPLDIDLENLSIRAVQIRVVALDEKDAEICNPEGGIIEGISDEFWLSEEEIIDLETKKKRDTVPTLPFARLRAVVELPIENIEEAPGQWSERDLHYYSITLNGRRVSRIGLSSILRQLEQEHVDRYEHRISYYAKVPVSEQIDPIKDVKALTAGQIADDDLGKTFLQKRKDFFRLLHEQGHRRLVEIADWSEDLSKAARRYAASYKEALNKAKSMDMIRQLLQIETLRLTVEQTYGSEQVILTLPTHPLRLLWYAAYADLLRYWETKLFGANKKERKRQIDLNLIERISPLNCPVFIINDKDEVFLFSQNLRLFWGVWLPMYIRDPSRLVADVASILGLETEEATLTDLPPMRLADELHAYCKMHPYLHTLRLNVLNPGSGSFLAESLRILLENSLNKEDDETVTEIMKIELMTHAHDPIPSVLPPLRDLQESLYDAQTRGDRHHLAPLFNLAIRPMDQHCKLPGNDVNVSVAVDHLKPEIRTVESEEFQDSSSFYGLLVRLLPQFYSDELGARWEHKLNFPIDISREKHPGQGMYTNDLVDLHRAYLETISRLFSIDSNENMLPAIVVSMEPEQRIDIDTLHHISDWVVTLDRFFGVEYYDNPGDSELSRVARKYLLDYAPEFLEGLGHRLLVTTSHREEVEELLYRAMRELGFNMVEESAGEVLNYLKTISGRLVLRVVGDDAQAKEAVSLGVVTAYLKAKGDLEDSMLLPVDSHPELFSPRVRRKTNTKPRSRCDLVRIRFMRNRLHATFIEVKSRSAAGTSEELLNRIADQITATEEVFRDLFFQKDPPRLDHVLQRSRLVTILRFYLQRAKRYGLITSEESYLNLENAIGRLEVGIPDLRADHWGFVVNLASKPQRPVKIRNTLVRFITAHELAEAGFGLKDIERKSEDERKEEVTEKEDEKHKSREDKDKSSKISISKKDDVEVKSKDLKKPEDRQLAFKESPDDVIAQKNEYEKQDAKNIEVEVGSTIVDQDPITWKPSVRGSPHLFILGIPGQGKSWTITRILCDLANQKLPALVIDFHGQFAESDSIYSQTAQPLILDASKGLPFSPFEADVTRGSGASFWKTNAFAIAEIFQYVCGLGDIQRDVVFQAVRDSYLDLGFEEGEPERLPTIEEVSRNLEEVEGQRGIKNVIPRCRPLLDFGLFQEQEGDQYNLREALEKGLVIDLHSLGLETTQLGAGAFILRKIYKDMFTWGEADRLRLAIVLDEAHRLAQDITLPKIMKEGRKFGIAVVVASQGLADYHPDVVGNAGSKIVFRTNFPMSKKVAGFLRTSKGFELAADIEQLDVGEAYIQTPELSMCKRVRMHPLV